MDTTILPLPRTESGRRKAERKRAGERVESAQDDYLFLVAKVAALFVAGSSDYTEARAELTAAGQRLASVYDVEARAWQGTVTYWAMRHAAEGLRARHEAVTR